MTETPPRTSPACALTPVTTIDLVVLVVMRVFRVAGRRLLAARTAGPASAAGAELSQPAVAWAAASDRE